MLLMIAQHYYQKQGIQGPVVEALEEKKKAEDRSHTVERTAPPRGGRSQKQHHALCTG